MLSALLLTFATALGPEHLLLTPATVEGETAFLLVDARPAEAYAAGHAAGAAHLDPSDLAEDRDGVPGMLKALPEVLRIAARHGVDPSRHVVVYAEDHGPDDLKHATRLFWALEYAGFPRVSVLDGGFARWRAENRPVETGPGRAPVLDAGSWSLSPRKEVLATRADVIEVAKSGEGQLMDLRTPEDYAGLTKRPFVKKAGHIPGAHNLPVADTVQGEAGSFCTMRPLEEVRAELLRVEGGDPATRTIAYCNSGRDATVGYLVYRLAGFTNISVYDGSMAEWGNSAPPALTGDGGADE